MNSKICQFKLYTKCNCLL